MSNPFNIVFCADHRVLPGLHVATYSLLDRVNTSISQLIITIFSDALDDADMDLLDQTLQRTGKPYSLTLHRITPTIFAKFPMLNDSWATYYRLYAAQVIDADRFLYVDADTLCDLDVSGLQFFEMGDKPVAWVPEAPLHHAADRNVAKQLNGNEFDIYFNAGVMLINSVAWRQQNISERAMDYISTHRPIFHDQSALNVLLHRNAISLDPKFNCISNIRTNWPAIKKNYGSIGKLIHFVDYPKPWDLSAEWVHPQYALWRSVLDKTAMSNFRSWHRTAARRLPQSSKAWSGYWKSTKDQLLFFCYQKGWLSQVKGM
ncbi:MAG: glycosyltransferase family 8 protein [Cyanothece sp. SIO1E1]|nr:glycosyltransferase family 8 protein [Cyanothece sp. SIO1E1]